MLIFFFCGCRQHEKEISRSFYYWQSNFDLSTDENKLLADLNIKKLYIKFFDVTWEEAAQQPIPVAAISFIDRIPPGISIIPVVFITNQTLQKLQEDEVKTLAFKISKKVEDLLQTNNLTVPQEIQLDCDWSETTKEKYFLLIHEMKKFPSWEKTNWSATIRLHQIKYFEKTGIPPVNRGMLMFYNTGNIEDIRTENSIYSGDIAGQYLSRISDYPLALDVAIACFSWGLLYEDNRLLKIFYPLYKDDLSDTLFTHTKGEIYNAKKDFYFEGTFITRGNAIRLETMTPERSLQSAELIAPLIKNDSIAVILYHLDSTVIKNFTNAEFNNIYTVFE